MTPKRIKHLEMFGELNNNEALIEMLFAQQLIIEKLEDIRSNTSKLVWWLVALPVILGILIFALGGLVILREQPSGNRYFVIHNHMNRD